ncbi:hypothetical protein PSDVSF_30490 [Pseudodesulfovibrio sediminis]|uniref:Uncharacterized protein n=1 Tax=Pseudodesulfovibrio sediminis TaxID=2810563 RepID=A0ABM7P9L6_9BACT|nr:hypothetical protein PSDVSF_30490 [Pseudodesulfovibrio sediminis]
MIGLCETQGAQWGQRSSRASSHAELSFYELIGEECKALNILKLFSIGLRRLALQAGLIAWP